MKGTTMFNSKSVTADEIRNMTPEQLSELNRLVTKTIAVRLGAQLVSTVAFAVVAKKILDKND